MVSLRSAAYLPALALALTLAACSSGSSDSAGRAPSFRAPTGLTLDANGTLSGTPTASGMTSFTVQATDGAGLVATQSYTLNVVDMAVNASVSFAQPSQSTTDESTRTVSVALRLDAPSTTTSDTTVTVTLAATGTAIAGADFTFTTQSVTFPAGSSNGAIQSVPVGINADAIFEGDETVVLGLSGPGAGAGATHTLTITDDDAATIAFAAGTSTAAEAGGTSTVTVTLTVPGGGDIKSAATVELSDAGTGSATSGSDYQAVATQTLTFAAGSSDGATQSVTVTATADADVEGDETINLALASVTGTGALSRYLPATSTVTCPIISVSAMAAMAMNTNESRSIILSIAFMRASSAWDAAARIRARPGREVQARRSSGSRRLLPIFLVRRALALASWRGTLSGRMRTVNCAAKSGTARARDVSPHDEQQPQPAHRQRIGQRRIAQVPPPGDVGGRKPGDPAQHQRGGRRGVVDALAGTHG